MMMTPRNLCRRAPNGRTTVPSVSTTAAVFVDYIGLLPTARFTRERRCADTIGAVPVPRAGHFQR